MPQHEATTPGRGRKDGSSKSKPKRRNKPGSRYSVGLPHTVAAEVERYAETVDVSVSKAIAALVRLGLESQTDRKREFFRKLKENLAEDDPKAQDRMVDDFRSLILGR